VSKQGEICIKCMCWGRRKRSRQNDPSRHIRECSNDLTWPHTKTNVLFSVSKQHHSLDTLPMFSFVVESCKYYEECPFRLSRTCWSLCVDVRAQQSDH
jgi:hypothetical protein